MSVHCLPIPLNDTLILNKFSKYLLLTADLYTTIFLRTFSFDCFIVSKKLYLSHSSNSVIAKVFCIFTRSRTRKLAITEPREPRCISVTYRCVTLETMQFCWMIFPPRGSTALANALVWIRTPFHERKKETRRDREILINYGSLSRSGAP